MKLEAKTAKGEQIIKRYGAEWSHLRNGEVFFAAGFWCLIEPTTGDRRTKDHARRWVHPTEDKHFKVVR